MCRQIFNYEFNLEYFKPKKNIKYFFLMRDTQKSREMAKQERMIEYTLHRHYQKKKVGRKGKKQDTFRIDTSL